MNFTLAASPCTVPAGVVVHDGETGRALIALRVEFARRRRNPIISIELLNDLDAEARRPHHPGDVVVELLAEGVGLPRLHQAGGLYDHLRSDDVEHSPLVLLTPSPPVAALAPLARHRPRRRLARQLVFQRVLRRLLGVRASDRQEENSEREASQAYEQRSRPLHGFSSPEGDSHHAWTGSGQRRDIDAPSRRSIRPLPDTAW